MRERYTDFEYLWERIKIGVVLLPDLGNFFLINQNKVIIWYRELFSCSFSDFEYVYWLQCEYKIRNV